MNSSVTFSPARVAQLIADPGKRVFEPTPEQSAVITAPQHTPLLVVAGAGSGKTETMSQRVIWLVANGCVTPDQVLGLTFTRKAAGELSDRIRSQLHRLRDSLEQATEASDPTSTETVQRVRNTLLDHMSSAHVATYNSFAGTLIAEYGELAGIAADSVVIDEATAWRIAREVVNTADDPRLVTTDIEPNSVIELVLKLNRTMSEHLVQRPELEQMVREFLLLRDLPYKDGADTDKNQPQVTAATSAVANLPLLIDLAEAFALAKKQRGLIEFSDQVALALRIVERAPDVITQLRERFPVVLLDEYQDTSVGQTKLLSALFAGHGVTAVGDPHQSIYGWRGASAANLAEYADAFQMRAEPLSLSTSWRNASSVLGAANALVAPLSADSPVRVNELRARPDAPEGSVTVSFTNTVLDEANEIAAWLIERRNSHLVAHGEAPTCAIIMRQRALMPFISEVLTERGVPNEIVGVGGLLTSPEITEIICVLRCLWRVDAGSELIRLLTSPRWSVGVADLDGLREAARWLSERDHAWQRLSDEEREAQRRYQLPATEHTILEALDVVCAVDDNHAALEKISADGLARMRELGEFLSTLRSRAHAGLAELVHHIELELRLDIELVANETVHRNGGRRARANLDAFTDLVETFVAVDDEGTLASFLAWLDRALRDDSIAEQTTEPSRDAVQLITVHGSKGLEWDYVVIARMVDSEFPSAPKGLGGWTTAGELPYELRGDTHSQPKLEWRGVGTKLEFKQAYERFRDDMREHLGREERRLAYVALTRAREALLLTGSFWSSQSQPRAAGLFLHELAESGHIPELPPIDEAPARPDKAEGVTLSWPLDPLGNRRARVETAAASVRDAQTRLASEPSTLSADRFPELTLLLAERQRGSALDVLQAPERISASAFKDFVTKPEEALRKLRRPMPERPYRQAKIGTLFHHWFERRYATVVGSANELDFSQLDEWQDTDAHPSTDRDEALETTLDALKAAFEASPWGSRPPIAIEREVTIPFAGRSLVCKLDAVYENEDGTFEIVDWKTGAAPKTDAEREDRLLQLELYRHAFAKLNSIEPEEISCALFYVASGEILRTGSPVPLSELENRWLQAIEFDQDHSAQLSYQPE